MLVISYSSWSSPNPKEWIEKLGIFLFFYSASIIWNFASAPLSCPSDRRKIDVTLFSYFLYLIDLNAIYIPLLMSVPPPAWIFSITYKNKAIFWVLRGRNPRFRLAVELKVIIESLSCGVNVSSKNFIVFLRS